MLTDCESLYDHLTSKSAPTLDDKRTALDVVIIRESIVRLGASLGYLQIGCWRMLSLRSQLRLWTFFVAALGSAVTTSVMRLEFSIGEQRRGKGAERWCDATA